MADSKPHQESFAFTTQPKPVELPPLAPSPEALRDLRSLTYKVYLGAVVLAIIAGAVYLLKDWPSEFFLLVACIVVGLALHLVVIALLASYIATRLIRRHERRHHR
jgi:CHASE1-domain containing sensor protein